MISLQFVSESDESTACYCKRQWCPRDIEASDQNETKTFNPQDW